MDRKATLILIVSFGLLMLWYPLTNRLYPPRPTPATNQVAFGTNRLAATNASLPQAAISAANQAGTPASPIPGVPPAAPLSAEDAVAEQTLKLENEDGIYTFSSKGGGLKLVELKQFPQVVDCGKSGSNTNALASLNTKVSTPILAVLTGEGAADLSNYTLSERGGIVSAERALGNGIWIVKRFLLSSNYLVNAVVRHENRGEEPAVMPSHGVALGAATPIGLKDESLHLGFEWYNGDKAERETRAWFDNRTLGCFPGTPRTLFEAGSSNVVWAAVHNQFFTLIGRPEKPAPSIQGRMVNLPHPTMEELKEHPKAMRNPFGFTATFMYPSQIIPKGGFVEEGFLIFAGPKEYNTLSRLPSNMDLAMGFGRFFGIFAKALLLAMNALHSLGISYGLAIICITVVVKSVFWPLTVASTRSMKRMAELQPQMKVIQEKYKEDPRKMQMKMAEFWKENKINPMAGCWPILLQIPVFIGFYQMLQSAIELRGASFLWACDLSQADTVFTVMGFPVNPLALSMGATMFWQSSLTPPSPGMDPMQQKMMKYMPLMIVVFLYNFSAGLTLYWTVQNLISILQMKLTKAKAGPTAPQAGAGKPHPAPAGGSHSRKK